MTSKKEMDKFLSRLQKMQRECFKKGSRTRLQLDAAHDSANDDYTIYVCAYNLNVVKHLDDGEEYNFEHFAIYQFYEVEQNECEMQRLVDFLNIA